MANAGTVTVDFAAEVAKFNASLKQVNDRVKSVESGFKALEKVATTALQFFSVGVATNFIRSAADAAEQLSKTADQLGIGIERLKAFEVAAADAGVETGTLNRLLVDSQRRLSDAANGAGPALRVLQSFGFNIRELQQLSPDELFLRYADAINSLTLRSDQFAAAQALFGQSAMEAFDLIEKGRPGIEEAERVVQRFGLALSDIDARKIRDAKDQLGILGQISQAFGQQIAATIAPYVSAFVESIKESGISADETRGKIEVFARVAALAFGVVSNAAKTFDAAVSGVVLAIAKFDGFVASKLGLDRIEAFMGAVADQAQARVQAALDGIRSFAQMNAEIDEILNRAQERAQEAAAARAQANGNLGVDGTPDVDAINVEFAIREDLQRLHYERMLEMQQEFQEASAQLTEQLDVNEFVRHQEFRERTAIESEQRILQFKQMAHNAALGLLQALASRSKAAAIALIAINKARAIAETIQETARGVVFWTARGNLPMAAFTKALGAASVAAIAATGLVEARQVTSSPGPGAPLGSPTNPVFTDTATDEGQTFGAQQRSQIQITVEGVVTPGAARAIAEAIRDVVDNSDVHIIGPNSSQAQELRGG